MFTKPTLSVSCLALFVLTTGGCSWVSPTPAANEVQVATKSEVGHCQRLGSATAKSLAKVGFINRNREKLQEELNTLARNEAVGLGGNTVVAESPIEKGQQLFGVYRCP